MGSEFNQIFHKEYKNNFFHSIIRCQQQITPRKKDLECIHNVISNDFTLKALEKKVVADYDGGNIKSDAGALLFREINLGNHFFDDFASCFVDHREQAYAEYSMKELIAQRTIGLCLGYEDTHDPDELNRVPLLATVCGKMDHNGRKRNSSRHRGNALAGKSNLNRLETYGIGKNENHKYKKTYYLEEEINQFFVDTSIKTTRKVYKEIILDLVDTDDPLHGH